MAKGLDVGTSFLVSATPSQDTSVTFKKVRNAFLEVETSEFTTNMLKKSNVSFVEGRKNTLYVLGDAGLQMASIFKESALRRPLAKGVLSKGELEAVDVLSTLFKNILGEPNTPKEKVYYSIPADAADTGQDTRFHSNQLTHILKTLGYTPTPMNESLAIVFNSCKDSNFNGLAFSFGAGMVNACLAYRSLPVLEFAVARGGDWIDAKAAENTGSQIPKITVMKEKEWDLRKPVGRVYEALGVYYRDLIAYALEHLVGATEEVFLQEKVPVIISGGTTLVPGFLEAFKEEWTKHRFPFEVSEIRQVKDPLHAVAGGLLVAALSSD